MNEDGTYEIYFPEDSDTLANVPESDIKSPTTQTGKTTNGLSKYIGKVFYDGGSDGRDDEPYFEGGEFKVDSIEEDNNFQCIRLIRVDGHERTSVFDIGYVIRRIREYEEE